MGNRKLETNSSFLNTNQEPLLAMLKKRSVNKLAGFGALGVSLGLAAIFVLFVIFTIPRGGSGMDWTHAKLAWIGAGGVVAVLIVVHLVFARLLLRAAQEENGME